MGFDVSKMRIEEMWFDGPCPFVLCLETGRHSHPICPKCGAVRFGNMFCDFCRSQWPLQEIELRNTQARFRNEQAGDSEPRGR